MAAARCYFGAGSQSSRGTRAAQRGRRAGCAAACRLAPRQAAAAVAEGMWRPWRAWMTSCPAGGAAGATCQ